MTVSREAFRDLETAVGLGNVSDDPSTCVSYAWNSGVGGLPKASRLSPLIPAAVVLPASTAEVQQVIKLCIRHGLKFKPHSTGYGSLMNTNAPNSISMDLRRMNRIHQIDERNQMAVIEPYVTAGQLQAEAMRKGLNCHIVGAALTHSPLASATAMFGIGISGASTGNNVRNLLGIEWVSPEGEIVKIGAPGSECGWFTDEGPGPGFRGMIRGLLGTFGELGVFTRIGYKLYPWRGPKELVRTGRHPQHGVELPDHFGLHHLAWKSWSDVARASVDINKSGVADIQVRIPPNSWGLMLTASNNEFYDLISGSNAPEMARDIDACRCTWTLLYAASSAAEARYKERVLTSILERTGGRSVPLTQEQRELVARLLISSMYVPRVLRPSAALSTSFGVLESFRRLPAVMAAGEKCLAEDIKPGGALMQGAREEFWSWPSERRHLWSENAFAYSSRKPESRGAVIRYTLEHANTVDSRGDLGLDTFAAAGPVADLFGGKRNGSTAWARKIKSLFDRRGAQESFLYAQPAAPPIAPLWPLLRKVLFSRPFRPIFRRLMVRVAVVGLPGTPRLEQRRSDQSQA